MKMMNKIVKKRLDYIDTLKAIGILLVILGHISNPGTKFIYSFHMPLFFIISGFFIKFDISFKKFITSDIKRLIVPYFIFSIFGVCVETIKRFALHRPILDYVHEIKAVFIYMDFQHLINSYANILWFLPALFFARLLLYLIHKNIKNILLQIGLIIFLFIAGLYLELPFALDEAMNALLFVFVGNMYFKYFKSYNILILCLALIVVLLAYYGGIPKLNMATKDYESVFINILWAIGIVGIMIDLLKRYSINNNYISLWGRETMFVYIFHAYTNNIAHILVPEYWYVKFFITLSLLIILLIIKIKVFKNRFIFKYI